MKNRKHVFLPLTYLALSTSAIATPVGIVTSNQATSSSLKVTADSYIGFDGAFNFAENSGVTNIVHMNLPAFNKGNAKALTFEVAFNESDTYETIFSLDQATNSSQGQAHFYVSTGALGPFKKINQDYFLNTESYFEGEDFYLRIDTNPFLTWGINSNEFRLNERMEIDRPAMFKIAITDTSDNVNDYFTTIVKTKGDDPVVPSKQSSNNGYYLIIIPTIITFLLLGSGVAFFVIKNYRTAKKRK